MGEREENEIDCEKNDGEVKLEKGSGGERVSVWV